MVVHPKESRACWQLTLLKIGKGSCCEFVLQSALPVWFRTHWVGGRQFLCPRVEDGDETCPCCTQNVPRVTGFAVVTAISGTAIRPFLFEMSDSSWAKLRMLAEMSQLRVGPGLMISAHRRTFRRPLDLEPLSVVSPMPGVLGSERALLGAVSVLFGLPVPSEGQCSTDWWAECSSLCVLKLRTAIAKELAA